LVLDHLRDDRLAFDLSFLKKLAPLAELTAADVDLAAEAGGEAWVATLDLLGDAYRRQREGRA
jgi:hypothetical protein